MRFLSSIPLPLRIVALILLSMLVVKAIGVLGSFVIFGLVVLLWLLVLFTLFYEFGWLNSVASIPIVSRLFGFLSNRKAIAINADQQEAQDGPQGKLSELDRRTLYEKAEAQLHELRGIEHAVDLIYQRLVEPAKQNPENPFATQSPALVALFAGPRGIGKTTAAIASAQMLAGCGAMDTAHVAVIKGNELRSGEFSNASALGASKAREALDGTLLIENADWLLDTDAYGGEESQGVDLGLAILEVAQEYPRRVLILLTMSTEAAERLASDDQHSRWLGKLTRRNIAFQPFEDSTLLDLLELRLADVGWRFENEKVATQARRLLDDQAQRLGVRFDNAEACRRIAELLVETARSAADSESLSRSVVTREIVRIVDEEME